MHNKNVLSFVALLILIALVALAVHCTPKQQETALGTIRAVNSGCVATEDIRAAAEELLRARVAASATSSAAAAPSGGAL